MTPGIVIAIAIGIATALGVALVAARSAGEPLGPQANYGRELEGLPRGRRPGAPGVRPRAMLAIVMVAIAGIGAGIAVALNGGTH